MLTEGKEIASTVNFTAICRRFQSDDSQGSNYPALCDLEGAKNSSRSAGAYMAAILQIYTLNF